MRLVIEQGARRVVVDTSKVKAVGTGPFNLAPRGVEVVIAIGADDVVVEYAEGGVDVLKTAGAAAAAALVARITAAIGELMEPLSEGPDAVEARAGLAAIIGGTTEVGDVASEWVDGEPPRDGRWYVVAWGPFPNGAAWGAQWDAVAGTWRRHDGERVRGPGRHLPTPIPPR